MIIYADIHGCFDTFMALRAKIPREELAKGEVIAGDLGDRGPKSRQVIEFVIEHKIPCVKGNHEEMMSEYDFRFPDTMWIGSGGRETLDSYTSKNHYDENSVFWPVAEDDFDSELFEKHQKWMANLPIYLEYKDIVNERGQHLLITHSSAGRVWHWDDNRRKQQARTFEQHLLWNRLPVKKQIKGVYNVFGHTPIPYGPRIRKTYANVDTGCFYGLEPGYSKLSALQFPEMVVYRQDNIDEMSERWSGPYSKKE